MFKRFHYHVIYVVFMFGFGLSSLEVFSQGLDGSLTSISPPSPSVASLMHFEELPVDYYTGQPDISIPIYSKSVSSNLSMNIGLRYTTLGLKVQSRSGWAGTGWALDIGGSISRTVLGHPDESSRTDAFGVFHNADFWNYNDLTFEDKNRFHWRSIGNSAYNYDTESDLYQYSYPGGSGRFVIVNESGTLRAKNLSLTDRTIIELIYDVPSYEITAFILTSVSGDKYRFDVIERTTTTHFTGTESQSSQPTQSGSQISYTATSSWHLSNVSNAHGTSLLDFSYQPTFFDYLTSRNITTNEVTKVNNLATVPVEVTSNSYNQSILKAKKVVSTTRLAIAAQEVSSIDFRDGTRVDVQVSANAHPETGGSILSSITLVDETGSSYRSYDFFYGTENGRLWLDKVEKISSPLKESYVISYINKELEDFLGVFNAWGYDEDLTAGLISHIDYPTGGRQSYAFEGHDYSYLGGSAITAADLGNNGFNTREKSNFFYFDDSHTFDSEHTIVSRQPITFTHDQTVEVTNRARSIGHTDNFISDDDPDQYNFFDATWLEVLNSSGETLHSWRLNFSGNTTSKSFSVQAGSDLELVVRTAQQGSYNLRGDIRITYEELQPSETLDYALAAGGVRVKSVAFYDASNHSSPTRITNYAYEDDADNRRSSGVLDNSSDRLSNDYQLTTRKYLFHTQENLDPSFSPTDVKYQVHREGVNLGLTKGQYVGYRRVSVSSRGVGRTEYHYSSAKDYPSGAGHVGYPFLPAKEVAYKHGLLTDMFVYNEANQLLRHTENSYEFSEQSVAPVLKVVDQELCEWKQFYNGYSGYLSKVPDINRIPDSGISLAPDGITPLKVLLTWDNCTAYLPVHVTGSVNDYYHVKTTWARPVEKVDREYFYTAQGAQQSTVRETYTYNTTNYQLSESNRFIREDGSDQVYSTQLYYAQDAGLVNEFSASEKAEAGKLIAVNKVTTPISSYTYKNGVLLQKVLHKYKEFSPSQVLLSSVSTARGNHVLEQEGTVLQYDAYDNVLESVDRSGVHTVYLWGYQGTVLLAQITNSPLSAIEAVVDLSLLETSTSALALEGELSKLRDGSLPSLSYVTTYRYVLSQGVNRITDPSGLSQHYTYDEFSRLKSLKDHQDNLLQYTDYNYHR